jgi:hypothetical protein
LYFVTRNQVLSNGTGCFGVGAVRRRLVHGGSWFVTRSG